MIKRAFDLVTSAVGILITSPIWLPSMLLIYLGDRHSPFYVANRIGLDGQPFRMIKFRSMVIGADRTGVDSTSTSDSRITPVGAFVRRYKVDELPQLVNVIKGNMSIVGPRPNVEREVALYTAEESHLLDVRPGITDISSIVFSDEGEILAGSLDPDLDYNQLIRPWKSRLGLLYVRNACVSLDFRIIWLTVVSLWDRERALTGVNQLLNDLGADHELQRVARRRENLVPSPPPGSSDIVRSRGASPE